ncbi:MAG TPA: 3'-5' exonuclease [Candidatus Enterosoma merdigallinarum]|nr:3'-5' exonuclease [Candidatus Enterosoma merdigallinarum]
MDYLFFDTECANCLHGEGKICSFGYVRTDENFHVLKKKDILVDPDAPFLLGNAKKGEGIQLGYPLSRFRYAHTFPYYYEEIKRLFQLPDTLYFGFCIHQDIGFLDYTCQRYGLPFFDFEYVDIQKLDKALFQCKDYRGLDTLVELFGLARFTYHRSDDDALMTMEVLQKLLLEQGLSLSDAMKRYPFVHGYSIDVARRIREKRRQKEAMRRIKEKAQALFAGKTLPSLSYYTPFFWNKKVAFRSRCLYRNLEYLLKNRDRFLIRGMLLVEDPHQADVIVFERGEDVKRVRELNPKATLLTFAHFQKKVDSIEK